VRKIRYVVTVKTTAPEGKDHQVDQAVARGLHNELRENVRVSRRMKGKLLKRITFTKEAGA
jgi:hypothetical protein